VQGQKRSRRVRRVLIVGALLVSAPLLGVAGAGAASPTASQGVLNYTPPDGTYDIYVYVSSGGGTHSQSGFMAGEVNPGLSIGFLSGPGTFAGSQDGNCITVTLSNVGAARGKVSAGATERGIVLGKSITVNNEVAMRGGDSATVCAVPV
jgi:hypothetical protein